MPEIEPTAELHEGFSQPDATATPWAEVVDVLSRLEMFWLSTVRRDGRLHVTPLPAVWLDGALRFCAGAGEQKAKNLEADPRCVLTTGTNQLRSRRRGRGSCRSRDRRGAAPTAGGDVEVEARLAFRGRLRGVPAIPMVAWGSSSASYRRRSSRAARRAFRPDPLPLHGLTERRGGQARHERFAVGRDRPHSTGMESISQRFVGRVGVGG